MSFIKVYSYFKLCTINFVHKTLAGQNAWRQSDEVSALGSFPFRLLLYRLCPRPRTGFVWDTPKFSSRWLSPQCQSALNASSNFPFPTAFPILPHARTCEWNCILISTVQYYLCWPKPGRDQSSCSCNDSNACCKCC